MNPTGGQTASDYPYASPARDRFAWVRSLGLNVLIVAILGIIGLCGHWFDWKLPAFRHAEPPEEPAADVVAVSKERESTDACERHFLRRRLEFPSVDAVQRAGIACRRAETRAFVDRVVANGTVHYDHTKVAHVTTRVRGIVRDVRKQLGQSVRENEALALIESPEVGKAKSDLLHYLVQVDIREKILAGLRPSSVPERRLREAEADLREARVGLAEAEQSLRTLGIPVAAERLRGLPDKQLADRVRRLGLPADLPADEQTSTNLVPLLAPFAGTVVGRDIVKGELVGPPLGQPAAASDMPSHGTTPGDASGHADAQFVIADLRTMHIHVELRPEDVARVRLGQPVHFEADGVPGLSADGQVEWISTQVDAKTRTLPIHVEVNRPDERLRAHLYGTAEVVVRTVGSAVAVPDAAVQGEGDCRFLFVRLSPTVYESRLVRTGLRGGGDVEITGGVEAGADVVTGGAGTLKGELLIQK